MCVLNKIFCHIIAVIVEISVQRVILKLDFLYDSFITLEENEDKADSNTNNVCVFFAMLEYKNDKVVYVSPKCTAHSAYCMVILYIVVTI